LYPGKFSTRQAEDASAGQSHQEFGRLPECFAHFCGSSFQDFGSTRFSGIETKVRVQSSLFFPYGLLIWGG
jgi:hypothetical protein